MDIKKFMCLILTLVILISACGVAFADSGDSGSSDSSDSGSSSGGSDSGSSD